MDRMTTIREMRELVAGAHAVGDRVSLVPTMGALHEGHLSLVRRSAEVADLRVVSIFVNPAQFGPDEDLDAYPRELDSDEGKLRALGERAPHVVFAPDVDEMYPREPLTTVHVDRLTATLCGVSRPDHFDGVTTVVAKLLNICRPDVLLLGRKDYQQLAVVRRMVADLDMWVEIVGVPTVREPDGVAMSSRNRYLGRTERRAARSLSQGLRRAVLRARRARREGDGPDPDLLHEEVRGRLAAEPDVHIDYVEVVDPDTLLPPDPGPETEPGGKAPAGGGDAGDDGGHLLVAVAAHVGPARLIDNVVIGDADDEERLLEATADHAEG